ncbi:penicillin acylase family protein [Pseudarthrobacter sp. J64]|uniref:penicillin acylase family protein n=1 Tax=Pseudarthrobacter sp. J64 TaxID=3116485 RepID=UPI002E8062DD|nr:penicillin acylase family protein [Pseudarthrobacter sp. J64]MEE2568917.1 penicillin acylase family protein [Pseudarthrobacter sp. J64]
MAATTYRDEWGIPHLRADSADELAYLQGANAARDRSWQIEMERWRSEGRTAEMLGSEGIGWDRFARQARLDDTARRCFEALDSRTRRWCRAYVDGVNAALAAGARDASEFAATGTSPSKWNPWTPLGVFLVHHILFSTFPNKLWRRHVAAALGPEAVNVFNIEARVLSGSNAWAAHGNRTASGLPLMAGDPHRLMELPGVYQQVHLACPEFDVVGFAFPGVPGLPHFAHTGTVAWGITNAMADYQDLYTEELKYDGGTLLARGPDGWEPATFHTETIAVRGGSPVPVDVIETARGPVIEGGPDGGALSLRTPARVESRLGFEALLPLLHSRSVGDVEAALQDWVEPVNSVLVADTAGTVRHFVAGLVPERNHENRIVPVPAASAGHQWSGSYVPLPTRQVTDVAASANDRAAGGGGAVAFEFAPLHRANRILELLGTGPEGTTLDAEAMERIALDTRQGQWPTLRALLARLEPAPTASADEPPSYSLLERLLGWDGGMAAGSELAGEFAAWRSALVQRLAGTPQLQPLAGPTGCAELFAPWLNPVARVGFALETLIDAGPRLGIDVDALALQALEDVASEGDSSVWGDRHILLPVHALQDFGPDFHAGAPRIPVTKLSGDTGCVLSTESVPGAVDGSFRGPVARYVWDLADRENSRWIVPFGASGGHTHLHFTDQLPLWTEGRQVPVVTDWAALAPEPGDAVEPYLPAQHQEQP